MALIKIWLSVICNILTLAKWCFQVRMILNISFMPHRVFWLYLIQNMCSLSIRNVVVLTSLINRNLSLDTRRVSALHFYLLITLYDL